MHFFQKNIVFLLHRIVSINFFDKNVILSYKTHTYINMKKIFKNSKTFWHQKFSGVGLDAQATPDVDLSIFEFFSFSNSADRPE